MFVLISRKGIACSASTITFATSPSAIRRIGGWAQSHPAALLRSPPRWVDQSFVKQARYLTQAYAIARANPRIDMMIWFLVRDEARIGNGWQSGFYTASGRRKPSFTAFRRMPK